jgi:uncharacterized membrane protein
MELLIAGLLLFFAVHMVPERPALRARLAGSLGELPYKGVFSLIAVGGVVLIVIGYGRAETVHLWAPLTGVRPLVHGLMLIAFILLAAAYLPNNLRRIVPHPMLAAVIIWAGAHLLVRGDLASVLLFGSFLTYAAFAWWSANRRGARKPARRRARWRDALTVGVGLFAYLTVLHFHF